MTAIASKSQLRASFLRYALVTVPAVLLLGTLSGRLSNSGYDNQWFAALVKPEAMPPSWLFPVAWSILYVLLGLALAMILHARGARGRGIAIGLFLAQLALNYSWSPTFFAAHKIELAFWIIVAMIGLSIAVTFAFARIRKLAAWLMVPYLVWISFAAVLNHRYAELNPNAETLVPAPGSANILI